ncbi:MAG: MurR/RpiR family transcriptional regulator [Bacteroidota bacterium]
MRASGNGSKKGCGRIAEAATVHSLEEQPVRERIRELAGRLSGVQETIARYILEHPTHAGFLSAGELAREIGVSSASVVRFAQSLGYDGFYSLKRALQREIELMVSPANKVQETLAHIGEVKDIFNAVVEMEISYLQLALRSISPDQFERAVLAIAAARRLAVFGPGSSQGLVHLLKFRLRRFRVDVIPMTRGGKDLYEDLHWLERGDALLVFAFLQPWDEVLTSLRYARNTGVTSVAITDLESSPVTALADITLVAQRGPIGAFHSLVVPNAIVNALILGYAKQTMPDSLNALKAFQAVRDRFAGEQPGCHPPRTNGKPRGPRLRE